MAERGQIKDLFALAELQAQKEAAIGTVREFLAVVKEAQAARIPLQDASKTKDVISGINGVSNATKEYQRILAQAEMAVSKYNGTSAEHLKNAKLIAEAELKQAQAAKENAKAATEVAKAKDIETKASERSAKTKKAELDEYGKLVAAYNIAQREAKNLASAYGVGSVEAQKAAANALALNTQIKAIDTSVGQSFRNVGNYGSAFSGLSKVWSLLRNIAYVVPGLGIAGVIGLIVDPIVMLTKKMFGASEEAEKLEKKMKREKEELSSLVDSFKDFESLKDSARGGTAAEIANVQSLANIVLDQTNSYKDRNAALKELEKIDENYFGNLSTEEGHLGKLSAAVDEYTNAIVQHAIVKEVEGEIGKVGAAYFRQSRFVTQASDALKQYNDNLRDANEADRQANQAKGIKTFLIDQTGQQAKLNFELDKQRKILNPLAEQYNALRGELEQLNIENLKFKPLGGAGGGSAQKIKAITEKLFSDELKTQADALKELSKLDVQYFDARLHQRQEAFEIEKTIIKQQRDNEIDNEAKKKDAVLAEKDVSKNAIINAENEYTQKVKEINQKAAIDLVAIEEEKNSDILQIHQSAIAKRLRDDAEANKLFLDAFDPKIAADKAEKAFEKRKNNILEDRDILITSIEKEKVAKLASAKTDEERQKIEEKYNRKRVLNELEADRLILLATLEVAEAKLKLVDDPVQRSALEAKIAELKKSLIEFDEKISKLHINIDTTEAQENLQKVEKSLQRIAQGIELTFKTIGGLIGASVDKQKNAIQDQIDLIEERKNKEIEAENASGDAAQVKADKIAVINARAASQKEQLERRQRQLDVERARFEKIANIARITVETALAVVHQLATGDPATAFARALTVGITGAAELAVALATPLPKFFKGKNVNDAYQGWGITGDGGKKELHIRENGNVEVTPNRPTLTWIGKKDIILPDADSAMKSLQYSAFKNMAINDRVTEDSYARAVTKSIEREIGGLKEVIKNKKELHIKGSHTGAMMLYKQAESWTKYLKDQTNW